MKLKKLALCLLVGVLLAGSLQPTQSFAADKADKKSESTKKEKEYTKKDLRLLSCLIYCEANAEPYSGKKAVAIIVMNRVKAKSFPNTVKGVIYQRGQFSPARNGSLNRAFAKYDAGKVKSKYWKQCIRAAKEALSGDRTIEYKGKTKNFKSYHFFSGRMANARLRIHHHLFK